MLYQLLKKHLKNGYVQKVDLLIQLDIEYAFKEEEKKEFAPIEIDMKEQSMSQSETENNSQSDDSD